MNCEQRSKEQLQEASEEVYYEISMFVRLMNLLASGKYKDMNVINNALVESFLIHTRLLIEFLYKVRSCYDDDIFAIHFYSSPTEWKEGIGNKSKYLNNLKKQIDKRVAHLTNIRNINETWNYPRIRDEIIPVFDKFIKNISPNYLSPKWGEYKKERTVSITSYVLTELGTKGF
ncbi:MAG: hypothetical protein K8R40_06605 [Anaerolineaceae bacterium]|nr:hypothetical protein [Anaerolineaceae bacterium]